MAEVAQDATREQGEVPMLTVKEAFEAVGGWYSGGETGYPSFGSAEALWRYTNKMQQNAVEIACAADKARISELEIELRRLTVELGAANVLIAKYRRTVAASVESLKARAK